MYIYTHIHTYIHTRIKTYTHARSALSQQLLPQTSTRLQGLLQLQESLLHKPRSECVVYVWLVCRMRMYVFIHAC